VHAVTICPQCAYEQLDTANFCAHCGAALRTGDGTAKGGAQSAGTVAGGQRDVAAPVAGGSDTNALVAQAVGADVALGRELVADGRPEVARAVFANALAVFTVSPTALSPEQGEQLMRDLRQCEQLATQANIACPTCEGSGKRALRLEGLTGGSGTVTTVTASGQVCPTCRGTGKIRRARSADDLKLVLGQARQQADVALQSRGRVPVGGAWVPPEVQALLTDASEVRLRHAAAAPCPSCQGIGRTDCKKCGNTGFVPCKEKDCEQGWVVKEELNKLGATSALKRREPCGACDGSGRAPCPDCHGAGGVTCKTCDGSGKRAICTACGGVGTSACRTCRGSGTRRDGKPCGDCGSDGVALCPTCRGDGYRSR
jgi:hypothetical protein